MVQRFEAVVEYKFYDYEENPTYFVKFSHSPRGDWVKYETYQNTVSQLEKQVNKLKKLLNAQYGKMYDYSYDYNCS